MLNTYISFDGNLQLSVEILWNSAINVGKLQLSSPSTFL